VKEKRLVFHQDQVAPLCIKQLMKM